MIDRYPVPGSGRQMRNVVVWFSASLLLTTLFAAAPVVADGEAAKETTQDKAERPTSPYFRPLARGKAGAPAFDGKFSIDRDQTIVILGGTNALETQKFGLLESALVATHPNYQLRVRNMAWQADTVYRQQRPRHFFQPSPIPYPGDTDGRPQIAADTIFLWMGQSESLEGLDRLEDFRKAYAKMVEQLSYFTPRIVLVTPVPFGIVDGVDLPFEERNKSLVEYVDVIKDIAKKHRLPVVDLFGRLHDSTLGTQGLLRGDSSGVPQGIAITRNGMHLNRSGHVFSLNAWIHDLNLIEDSGTGPVQWEIDHDLLDKIIAKDDLWFRYWRPTNWAFLYGNRSLQPSSRDHIDNKKRWFPKEVDSILPLVLKADDEIHALAKKATKPKRLGR